MKIYVGNLPFSATEAQVRDLFAQHGAVESVALPADRETGRPRGFGFVEMPQAEAAKAIEALNGFSMGGRQLRVNEAQDRPRGAGGRPGGGGGGRPGGGGGFRSGRRRWRRRWRRALVSIRPIADERPAQAGLSFSRGRSPWFKVNVPLD